MKIDEVLKLDRGAHFFRGDLHIHSVVGSHDVTDQTATPEAIVARAHQDGLNIIAITDHNEISVVGSAVNAGERVGLLVVPAVELSTSLGHLLCYLPAADILQRFYASLSLAGRGTPQSRCSTGVIDCLDSLKKEGGF